MLSVRMLPVVQNRGWLLALSSFVEQLGIKQGADSALSARKKNLTEISVSVVVSGTLKSPDGEAISGAKYYPDR